jgi:hypothetical protein
LAQVEEDKSNQRAPSVKNIEASQALKVDVLPEIGTFFRVRFVSGGQPIERVAIFAGGGLIIIRAASAAPRCSECDSQYQ